MPFRCLPIIDRAQCATHATTTQRAGVAYATHAPPLQAPLCVVLLRETMVLTRVNVFLISANR